MSNSNAKRTGKFKITVVFLSLLLLMTASFGAITANAASLPTKVTAELDGSDHYIDVPSSYGDWTVSENVDWISASPMSNYRFVISVKANTTSSSRTARVSVKGSITSYITVEQAANSLTANASTKTFSAASGGTASISVKVDYGSVSGASSNASWLKLTGSGSNYKVTVTEENLTGTTRTAKVSFSSGSMSSYITFTQNPYNLTFAPPSISSDATGSEHDISVSAEYGSWSVSESCDWLSAVKTGNFSLKIVTEPNPNGSQRSASVTVESGGTKKTVTVTQKPNILSVKTTSNSFAAAGGTNTITAQNTVGATNASSQSTWLTVTKSGNTYTVKATENLTGTPRTGVIAVTCGDITKTVTYTQNPHTLSLDLTEAPDTAVGGAHIINVSSSYSGWKVTPDDSWLTAVKTGNYSFIITVEPNINSASRKGTLTVESAGVKETFTINQSGNTMKVEASSDTFAANGAAITVTAELLTGSASAESEADWITASKNGSTFSVKASENLTGTKRIGSIYIICGNMKEKLTFTQEAHTLSIAPDSTKINAKGTPSEISVSSSYNGWKVYSEDAWITPSKTGNYSFKIAAKPNVNGTIRTGTVTVESAGVFATVTVTQAANSMKVTSSTNSFLPGGGTAVVIATPQAGATTATTGSTWISIIKAGNTYSINADENLTGAPRKGVVAIHCGDITKTVTFTQNPYTIPVSIGSISAAAEGSNHTISVPSAYGTWKVSEDCDWMNVVKTSNYSFVISVKPNADILRRTGTVTLTTQAGIKTLDVLQAHNEMTVTVTSNSFDPDGIETNTITAKPLTGKTSFSTGATWLKVTQKGNTFTVDATDNYSGVPRTGVVAIHCGDITKTVTFTQSSHTIKTDVTEVFMDGVTSTTTLGVVSTDPNWTASDDCDWITANKTGKYSLLIYAKTNNISGTREGTVTLKACDGKAICIVKVTQYGTPITIKLDPNGGTLTANSTLKRYYGEPLGKTPIPDAPDERYTFAGWYTSADGGTMFSADTKVEKNITLYAQWSYSVLELNDAAHRIHYSKEGEDFLLSDYGSTINRDYTYSFAANGTGGSVSPNIVGGIIPNEYTISVYCSESWNVMGSAPWIKVYNEDRKTEITGGNAGYYELYIVVGDNFTQNPGSWELVGSKRYGYVSMISASGKRRAVSIVQHGPGETKLLNDGGERTACLNRALRGRGGNHDRFLSEVEFYTLGTYAYKIGDTNDYLVTRCEATGCGISGDYYPDMMLSTDYIIFTVTQGQVSTAVEVKYSHNLTIDWIVCNYNAIDKENPFSMDATLTATIKSKTDTQKFEIGEFLVNNLIKKVAKPVMNKYIKKVPKTGTLVTIAFSLAKSTFEHFDGLNAPIKDGYTYDEEYMNDFINEHSSGEYLESSTYVISNINMSSPNDGLYLDTLFSDEVNYSLTISIDGYRFNPANATQLPKQK